MLCFLKQIFTWWNGSTVGTRFFTWRHGRLVGKDQFGNCYYESSIKKDGRFQRWVIYKNFSESSLIPPGWHGWIHHRVDITPCEENYKYHSWEKPYLPNLTLTKFSYKPKNKLKTKNHNFHVSGEYESWDPEK